MKSLVGTYVDTAELRNMLAVGVCYEFAYHNRNEIEPRSRTLQFVAGRVLSLSGSLVASCWETFSWNNRNVKGKRWLIIV
jgi:hypothetical protein